MRSFAERLRSFEQQKARLADVEARLKLVEKKQRTKKLIEAGTLLEKAGLADLPAETLYGGLLSLLPALANASQLERWKTEGSRMLANDDDMVDEGTPVVLTTEAALDKDAITALRSAGFRFNKFLQHWEGIVNFDVAKKLASAHGGSARQIKLPGVTPGADKN